MSLFETVLAKYLNSLSVTSCDPPLKQGLEGKTVESGGNGANPLSVPRAAAL